MMKSLIAIALLSVLAITPSNIWAQRGMGFQSGVGQQTSKPEGESFQGTISEILSQNCPLSTGRSPVGNHLVVDLDSGQKINLHLGPAFALETLVSKLTTGQAIGAEAFRTAAMPKDHYAAVSLTINGERTVLRDENLRPIWAKKALRQMRRTGFRKAGQRRNGAPSSQN